MRPLDRLGLFLDRTAVLFVGLAAGTAIGLSFLGGGGGTAGTPATPAPTVEDIAAALNERTADAAAPRLAEAVAGHRQIEIGVFGDSFGDGVWAGLYNQLRGDSSFEVHQFSERATGFTRYRSLDLLEDTREKLDRQPVDIAVLSYGANDTQGIFLDGHGHPFMSESWQRIVGARVDAIVALLRERGAMVYWVGLPRMRDPAFDADIQKMNRFYEGRMAALRVPYVETLPLTVDADGAYAPYLPLEPGRRERRMARTNDGVHMTIPGYIHVTAGLVNRIRGTISEARAAAPAPQRGPAG